MYICTRNTQIARERETGTHTNNVFFWVGGRVLAIHFQNYVIQPSLTQQKPNYIFNYL